MYHYAAYGLAIDSELALPEFETRASPVFDIVIHRGPVERPLSEVGPDGAFRLAQDDVLFHWEPLGGFRVRHGSEIIVDLVPDADEHMARLPLVGVVMAVALHQRGFLVLHGSAVNVGGEAIAFIGNKGHGKSTMAATLYSRGHSLLTDDVVAIDMRSDSGTFVLPGCPQFKLWPDSAAATLGDNPEHLPCLARGYEKRARAARARFTSQPVQLRSICTLSIGPEPLLQPLPAQQALLHLMAHTYVARFKRGLLHGVAATRHLQQCSRLLEQVRIFDLQRPASLEQLTAVARVVEERMPEAPKVAA